MVMNTQQIGPKMEHFPAVQMAPSPVALHAPAFVPIRPRLTPHIPIQPVVNSPVVTHFQPTNKKTQNVTQEEFVTDEYCVDRESVRRKFGWSTLGNEHHIPVIYRNGDKYCAVRMVDQYICEKFLRKISDNIYYGCTNILGYYVTIPESILLNEINEFHCDNLYGTVRFKPSDVVVKLEDANNFYEFLTVVSNKLFNTSCSTKQCGFITRNGSTMVPYVTLNDQVLLPCFYLDGVEDIKFKVQIVKNWNLSYLKFCFKVHGVRDEFWKRDDCNVITLNELVQHLEPGELFQECWPNVPRSNKNVYQPKKNQHMLKEWHQHPITVLPISSSKNSTSMPSNRNILPTILTNQSFNYRTMTHSQGV